MEQDWWEAFDRSLYVDIEIYQQILDDWAKDTKTTKRVKPIIGPAGSGKSWFLQATKLRWESSQQRLVFYLNVPDWVNKDISLEKNVNKNSVLNVEAASKYLQEFARLAEEKGADAWKYDNYLELPRNVEIFTELLAIFAIEYGFTIFLLVDGYDEVGLEQSLVVASRILDIFARKPFVRIVLARRDHYHRLSGYLRDLEDSKQGITLSVIPSPELQLQKFKAHKEIIEKYPNTKHLTIELLRESLKNYQWNHAFINTYLFFCAHQKLTRRAITQLYENSDIKDCIERLIQRPHSQNVSFETIKKDEFELMQKIANELNAEWSETELQKNLKTSLSDPRIESLFRFGVLQTVTKSPGKRKIADGLRELLRDYNQMGGK